MHDRQKVRFCTSSDGVKLAYACVGTGPPIVKASNWLTHLEFDWQTPFWRHWVEELSRNRTYVRYDSRGCGLSDREPREISFESWVRDLETVVDAMGLDRFPLLGVSQGGAIAAAYAVRHPERVSHLIIYGGFTRGRLKRARSPEQTEEALLYHQLAQLGWGTDNAAFRQVFASQFMPDATLELLHAFDELQRVSTTAAYAHRYMQVVDQVDVSELLPRVSCPTLILHARGDARVSFEEGRRFASLVPGARFIPLESRDHILLASDPAWRQFVEELRAFLPGGRAQAGSFAEQLSSRERELLEFLARGLDNHQIAAHLELSEKTVRNMVSSILAKLEVESRAQAIVRAREAGYGVGSPA